MKKLTIVGLMAATLLSLTSCGGGTSKVEGFPFRDSDHGRWGILGMDGKPVFSEEFKSEPTVAMKGVTIVRNADGLYELYAVDKNVKQIGDEAYLSVCPFTADVTPSVRKNGKIELINTDGKVATEIDRLDDKIVEEMTLFIEDRAIVSSGDLKGMVDTKGKLVVPFDYVSLSVCQNGYIYGVNKKYADVGRDEGVITILNSSGKEVGSLKMSKFDIVGGIFEGGYFTATYQDDASAGIGILDLKGEWVVKPSEKYKSIVNIRSKHFVYSDGSSCGLATLEGEVTIRPKYDGLAIVGDNLVAAYRDKHVTLMDFKGEPVGDEEYTKLVLASTFLDGKAMIAADSPNSWFLIGKDGKPLGKESYYEIDVNMGPVSVTRDFVDYDAILSDIDITAAGMGGVTFNDNAEKIAKLWDIEAESMGSTMVKSYESQGCQYWLNAEFAKSPVEALTHEETRGYWYTYTVTVTDGYKFTDATPSVLYVDFSRFGKSDGKTDEILKALNAKAKSLGALDDKKSNDTFKYYNGKGNTVIAVGLRNGNPTLAIADKSMASMAATFDGSNVAIEEVEMPTDTLVAEVEPVELD